MWSAVPFVGTLREFSAEQILLYKAYLGCGAIPDFIINLIEALNWHCSFSLALPLHVNLGHPASNEMTKTMRNIMNNLTNTHY